MSSFNTSQISNASLKSEGSLGSTLMEKEIYSRLYDWRFFILFLTVSEKSRNVFNDGRYHVISIIDPGAQVHRDSCSSCPNILVIIIIVYRFEKKLINNAENKCMNTLALTPSTNMFIGSLKIHHHFFLYITHTYIVHTVLWKLSFNQVCVICLLISIYHETTMK